MHLIVDLVLVGSFLLFMIAFAGVGLASMLVKEDTTDDYLVAGRGMHPALACFVRSQHLELRIHVHRIHWFHIHDGILDSLDSVWVHDRADSSMAMAV